MLRFLLFSLLIVVPVCSYSFYSQYNLNPCASGVPCYSNSYNYAYGCCCCPQQQQQPQQPPPPPKQQPVQQVIVEKCIQIEWICPKNPRTSKDSVAIAPPAGTYVTFCDYDEQCLDVDDKPHKCCFDSATNTKICKPAVQRTL